MQTISREDPPLAETLRDYMPNPYRNVRSGEDIVRSA